MRRGLELILRDEGMRVAAFATDSQRARSLISGCRIDVALITAGLASENDVALVSELLAVSPTTAVVLYGMSDEPELLAQMQASGARGIVLRTSEPSVLVRAIRTAALGFLTTIQP
jgi:DNA-binding NarL/FixJ family response regulator